jgi:long-chain acyl-CoA synthetase
MAGPRTIDFLFRRCVENFPQRDFLRLARPSGGALRIETTTFAEAAGRVAATVQRLQEIGLGKGDMVMAWTDDAVESIYFFLACFHVGAVPVPLAPSFSVDYVERIARRTHAKTFYALPADAARLREHGLPALCFADAASEVPPGVEQLPMRADLSPTRALDILRRAGRTHGVDDPLIITPTSGSTGEPKLPVWSHVSMERAADNLRIALGWTEETAERALLVNAPTHGLGLTLISGALVVGATVCIPSRIDVHAPLDEVRALDFTYSFMTPRVLRSLHAQHVAAGSDASARLFGPGASAIAFAGAPPPVELFPLLESQGVDPIDVWGASETGNIACSERGQWRAGTLRPFPGIEVKVGAGNELALRSSHFFLGYFGDPELTRQALTPDGYYLSGDAGEVLANGLIRLTGRTRDVFNTFEGSNIWPGRIETMLEGLAWVRQAMLLGDQRPFCSALIVAREQGGPMAADGLLDPEHHAALYEAAQADLRRLNTGLESIEQVRRFLLFGRPFPTEVYATVGAASKIRRDRAALGRGFEARIQQIYQPSFPALACVEAATAT